MSTKTLPRGVAIVVLSEHSLGVAKKISAALPGSEIHGRSGLLIWRGGSIERTASSSHQRAYSVAPAGRFLHAPRSHARTRVTYQPW